MPENQCPLLFFPAPEFVAPPPSGRGGGNNDPAGFLLPGKPRQIVRLEPRFTELDRVFQAKAIEVATTSDGAIPECVLVVETKGTALDFKKALRNTQMEWLAEFDLDEVDPDEDFRFEDETKTVKSHVVFSFANHTAKQELLRLWGLWKANTPLPNGKTEWRKIFEHLSDIRAWGLKDRIREHGILDAWKQDLEDQDLDHHRFEIELWFRDNAAQREAQILRVRRTLESSQGRIIGTPAVIEDARFCAIKAELPAAFLRSWIERFERDPEQALGPFESDGIRSLRPSGCSVSLSLDEAQDSTLASSPVQGDPLVAVLDGVPATKHRLLASRISLHDPDDFETTYLAALERKHGTAMCSLVSLGELDAPTPLARPIVCRPIMQPDPHARDFRKVKESIPSDTFAEELVWRAVHELLDHNHPQGAAAPSVRIINLSVCDMAKPFHGTMSSWGRVLDCLSWKFNVLFLVATGNISSPPGAVTPVQHRGLSEKERRALSAQSIAQDISRRRILAPSDSINALAIGAAHCDASTPDPYAPVDLLPGQVWLSPISRQGPGFKRSVKPDVLFPGGRQLYQDMGASYRLFEGSRPPGTKAAAPSSGGLPQEAHSRGSSNATALASNAAGRILEHILKIRSESRHAIEDQALVPLTKALLVHGAHRSSWVKALKEDLGPVLDPRQDLKEYSTRFTGYGMPDIARVLQGASERATLLGTGRIARRQTGEETIHRFQLPLPPCLDGWRQLRRLTITLAWISPVTASHKSYRQAKLEVRTPNRDDLGVKSGENHHFQIERGTLWHNVFEGKTARSFVDGSALILDIASRGIPELDDIEIPYGLAVTFEVAEGASLPIYQEIRDKVMVQTRARVRA